MDYQAYKDYFQAIAENHKQVKHSASNKRFFGINIFELEDSLQGKANFPFIGLERPNLNAEGRSFANLRWQHTGAILIVDKVSQRDPSSHDAVIQKCSEIAKDIVAKMVKDAKVYSDQDKDYVLPDLQHQSFNIEAMPAPLHGFMLGVRLSFAWGEGMEFFDVSKWDDEADYGI